MYMMVMVLMGGNDCGIYLNVIKVVWDLVEELWNNINIINDVVCFIFISKKIIILVVCGNVGVGGVMMVLVSDFVVVWEGFLLNFYYKKM